MEKELDAFSEARFSCMQFATGEYIAFLDSDDYVEETMYEEMYNVAQKEAADMVECNFIWEYPDKKREDIGAVYNSKREMVEKARVVAWNKLIKRELLEKTGVKFPIGLRYEDVEFFYKLLTFFIMQFIKENI